MKVTAKAQETAKTVTGKAPKAPAVPSVVTKNSNSGAGAVVETEEIQPRRRRRLTPTQKRAKARLKMRAWREAQPEPETPATPEQKPSVPEAPIAPDGGSPSTQGGEQPAPASVAPGPSEAEKVSMTADALAGTLEMLTEAVKSAYLGAAAPSFGHDRARKVAELWAPLLAPYLDERTAAWMPWALASGVTAQAALEWRAELIAFKGKDVAGTAKAA
jgi:hypothetical protein